MVRYEEANSHQPDAQKTNDTKTLQPRHDFNHHLWAVWNLSFHCRVSKHDSMYTLCPLLSNERTLLCAIWDLFLLDFSAVRSRFKVQGSRFFIIRHIHNHTSIISSEMQVELKKNTAFTWGKGGEKNYPQTMLLGEYSVRTGKTPQQHKSTYTT